MLLLVTMLYASLCMIDKNESVLRIIEKVWNILFNGSSALKTWRWTLTDVLIHIRLYSKQYRQKRLGFTAVTSATNDGNPRLHINCQSIHTYFALSKQVHLSMSEFIDIQ